MSETPRGAEPGQISRAVPSRAEERSQRSRTTPRPGQRRPAWPSTRHQRYASVSAGHLEPHDQSGEQGYPRVLHPRLGPKPTLRLHRAGRLVARTSGFSTHGISSACRIRLEGATPHLLHASIGAAMRRRARMPTRFAIRFAAEQAPTGRPGSGGFMNAAPAPPDTRRFRPISGPLGYGRRTAPIWRRSDSELTDPPRS
jgi:hypothetical protein